MLEDSITPFAPQRQDEICESVSNPQASRFAVVAVGLRAFDWCVLPSKGKKPIVKFAWLRSRPSTRTIDKWSSQFPHADTVFIPGLTGPHGLVVVDADDVGRPRRSRLL